MLGFKIFSIFLPIFANPPSLIGPPQLGPGEYILVGHRDRLLLVSALNIYFILILIFNEPGWKMLQELCKLHFKDNVDNLPFSLVYLTKMLVPSLLVELRYVSILMFFKHGLFD